MEPEPPGRWKLHRAR